MSKPTHYLHYLRAMGIPLWRRQRSESVTEPALDATVEGDADVAATPEPDPIPNPMPAPAATAATQAPTGGAVAALDWEDLRKAVDLCTACPLHEGRTRSVFGVGNRAADWMIIGEAPGKDEDRLGEPFVGRAGKLLDLMLRALSLDRGDVYIANILKSRPPNNRDPAPAEVAACWPYLGRQIELVAPRIILATGRIAAHNLLETTTPVGRLRGRVHSFVGPGSPPGGIPLVVTYHPAYLLRSPREKRKSWDDLQMARKLLDESG